MMQVLEQQIDNIKQFESFLPGRQYHDLVS